MSLISGPSKKSEPRPRDWHTPWATSASKSIGMHLCGTTKWDRMAFSEIELLFWGHDLDTTADSLDEAIAWLGRENRLT